MASSTALFRKKDLLRQRLAELPAAPGIYRFYDASATLVYVGKSVCLRDRVRSYFTGQASTAKVRRMRQEIAALDWEETGSELAALLLESRLVKRHQPRFNVLLREFVPLPYVRVDIEDPFPRLEITRAPGRDGATYFGPFRSQARLETGVSALSDALKLRDCTGPGGELGRHRRCYRYEFGTCSAPCDGSISAAEYADTVRAACAVLGGRGERVVELLRLRMERAAERQQFEIAARLRDAIRQIQAVGGRQQALHSAVSQLSLVAACPSRATDRLCVFVFCSGRLVFQSEVPRESLSVAHDRAAWALRLVQAWVPAAAEPVQLDAALLDEIQIVTAWMKQKTADGAYWMFTAGADVRDEVQSLSDWLLAFTGDEVRAQEAA